MKPNVFTGNVALNSLLFCIDQFQTDQTLINNINININIQSDLIPSFNVTFHLSYNYVADF